jgi:hypothetical protein
VRIIAIKAKFVAVGDYVADFTASGGLTFHRVTGNHRLVDELHGESYRPSRYTEIHAEHLPTREFKDSDRVLVAKS